MKDIAYKYQGLPTLKDAWDDLSMTEKSEMMRVAVRNGITNLQDIRRKYNEFAGGGYKPSDTIKKRIAAYEGAAMNGAIDPLSGKWDKNDSFENEAARFYAALPESIRDKVIANPQLADNLYSYSYNVGAGNFRKRVVPALTKYYEGKGRVEEVLNSMWASGDAKLRGLRRRRAEEKEGVKNALSSLNEGIQEAPVDNTFVYNLVGPLGQTSLPTPIMIPDEKEYVKATYTEPVEREKQDALDALENLRKLKAFQEQMGWLFQPSPQTNTPGYVVGAYSNGGHIHIDPSKKGTFTAAASKHGMGVQEFASKVLSHPDDYSPAMRRKANFARNSAKWHGLGGNLFEDGGSTSGIFGNKIVDGVTSYLPIIGTAQDAYQLYKNPSWQNAGWLGLSLASDLLGAGLLKGVKAIGKGAKAATKVEKAAEKALDTHRRTTKNIIARSIREEDRRLTQNLTRARENAALAKGQHFWEGVTTYPVAVGWTANDAGMNAIQNSAKALGGPLVERAMAHYYETGGPKNLLLGPYMQQVEDAKYPNGHWMNELEVTPSGTSIGSVPSEAMQENLFNSQRVAERKNANDAYTLQRNMNQAQDAFARNFGLNLYGLMGGSPITNAAWMAGAYAAPEVGDAIGGNVGRSIGSIASTVAPFIPTAGVRTVAAANNLRPSRFREHVYASKAPVGYDFGDMIGRLAEGVASGKRADIENPFWFNPENEIALQTYAYVPKDVPLEEAARYRTEFGKHALRARADAWRMHNKLPQKYHTFTPNERHPGTWTDLEGIANLEYIPPQIEGKDQIDFVNSVGGNIGQPEITNLGGGIPDADATFQKYGVSTTSDWFDLHPFSRPSDRISARLERKFLPQGYRQKIGNPLFTKASRLLDWGESHNSKLATKIADKMFDISDKSEKPLFGLLESLDKKMAKFEVGDLTGGSPFLVRYDIPFTSKTQFTGIDGFKTTQIPGFQSENLLPQKVFDWKRGRKASDLQYNKNFKINCLISSLFEAYLYNVLALEHRYFCDHHIVHPFCSSQGHKK